MLKIIIILLLVPASIGSIQACDFCNFYLSIYPNDYRHSIGLNYRYRSYKAYFVDGNTSNKRHFNPDQLLGEEEKELVEEFYQTIELQGRYYIKPEWQVVFSLPYSQNQWRQNTAITQDPSGLGDALAIGLYQFHNTLSDSNNFFRQRINGGAGIKVPTGAFEILDSDEQLIDPHLQPGTGSFDFILLTEYLARAGRFSTNASLSYRYNTQNKNALSFANRFNAYANVFYAQKVGKFTLMPELGLYFEQAGRDQMANSDLESTGGTVLFGSAGASVYYKRFSIFGKYQNPWIESLNDIQVPNYERLIFGLTFYFK